MSAKYTFLAWDTPVKDASTKLALLQLANNADDDGFSYYSISKMALSCDMSDRTFMRKIKTLEELKVLTVERRANRPSLYTLVGDEMGVTLCHLQNTEVTGCHPEVTGCHPEVTGCHPEVTGCHLVGDRLSHDLNSTPNTTLNSSNKIIAAKAPKFKFKGVLIRLGADKEVVSDWMEVRKKKKASNTKTAMKLFLTQVKKSGHTVSQAVEIAAGKSWSGFQASWCANIKKDENKNKDVMQISADSSWEDGINEIF